MRIVSASIMSASKWSNQIFKVRLTTNSLHIAGTKDGGCQLEQLFIENKFDPQDDQLKLLAELLAIKLNKAVK